MNQTSILVEVKEVDCVELFKESKTSAVLFRLGNVVTAWSRARDGLTRNVSLKWGSTETIW